MSYEKNKPKKEVYILQATYKENDPETIGAFVRVPWRRELP